MAGTALLQNLGFQAEHPLLADTSVGVVLLILPVNAIYKFEPHMCSHYYIGWAVQLQPWNVAPKSPKPPLTNTISTLNSGP